MNANQKADRPPLLARVLKTTAKIEPNETRAVLLSFGFSFILMTAYYILRPIRDSLSSNWTDAELSTLWTATFFFSAIAVSIYGFACTRVRVQRLVPAVYVFFAASFVAFFLANRALPDPDWANRVFYVWISVFSMLNMSVFWTFMADIYSKEQAPRLFGFIAAGSSIGAIAGPTIAVSLVDAAGRENLMLLSAVLLLVPIALIAWLLHWRAASEDPGSPRAAVQTQTIGGNPFAGFSMFIRNPYLLSIGLFIFLYTTISSFVYFELKNLMEGVDQNARVQIWAGMDLAVNVLAIATAMFGTSRIATRLGLSFTLACVPVLIVLGMAVVAMAPMLWVVVGLQIVRRAGNYAITRPGREMLFTAVDREARFKAKSVIDVVVYRGGDMVSGWAFTGLTQGLGLGLGAVAAIGAGIAAIWAAVGAYLGRVYKRQSGEPAAASSAGHKTAEQTI